MYAYVNKFRENIGIPNRIWQGLNWYVILLIAQTLKQKPIGLSLISWEKKELGELISKAAIDFNLHALRCIIQLIEFMLHLALFVLQELALAIE